MPSVVCDSKSFLWHRISRPLIDNLDLLNPPFPSYRRHFLRELHWTPPPFFGTIENLRLVLRHLFSFAAAGYCATRRAAESVRVLTTDRTFSTVEFTADHR